MFSSQKRLNRDTFSDRDEFSSRHPQVLGSNEAFIRFYNVAKSLLDGNRDHLLAEARSELMKQEYKVESPNTCITELQQHSYAQRLELEDAHHGYVESRQEQVIKEIARFTSRRIFCSKIERKSCHDTETHFTITRVAREDELHERFRRISRFRIELQWKNLTFPVNEPSFQVHVLC